MNTDKIFASSVLTYVICCLSARLALLLGAKYRIPYYAYYFYSYLQNVIYPHVILSLMLVLLTMAYFALNKNTSLRTSKPRTLLFALSILLMIIVGLFPTMPRVRE